MYSLVLIITPGPSVAVPSVCFASTLSVPLCGRLRLMMHVLNESLHQLLLLVHSLSVLVMVLLWTRACWDLFGGW